MTKSYRLSLPAVLVATLTLGATSGASAKTICGWYVIAACTSSQDDAGKFANGGWGAVIDTNHFKGLAPDLFCVVSGPQPKASAKLDLKRARENNVAPNLYIKRACADEKYIGD